jgi:hypothetical protein
MGYTTNFEGKLKLNKQLSLDDYNWLEQNHEGHNLENGAPDSYLQWQPSKDGWFIGWDGSEKFYYYKEWISWLIEHFFKPKGYILNGKIEWSGEEQGDVGLIEIADNVMTVREGKITYDESRDDIEVTLQSLWNQLNGFTGDNNCQIYYENGEWGYVVDGTFSECGTLSDLIQEINDL